LQSEPSEWEVVEFVQDFIPGAKPDRLRVLGKYGVPFAESFMSLAEDIKIEAHARTVRVTLEPYYTVFDSTKMNVSEIEYTLKSTLIFATRPAILYPATVEDAFVARVMERTLAAMKSAN
jgi:hypothetical protein